MKNDVIVLVNPPNEKIVLRDMYSSTISKGLYNWPCTDLLVLSGILKEFYDVKLIDANTLRLTAEVTADRVVSLNPKAVVFAFGNSVKDDDYGFIRLLRTRLPNIKICGTGGLLYYNAEYELGKHSEFDACLLNFTTKDIIKYIEGDYSSLNNVVYRANGKTIKTPIKNNENEFSYPVPLHEQLPLHKYNLSHGRAKPFTTVMTGYGCPATCSFCVSGKINYRYRNAGNVIEELEAVKKLGVKEIFFRDNVFCAQKKQGYSIMNMMIENNYGFSWIADTRANIITDETAEIMKESGCHALHIGVESGNPRILKEYNKGITVEQIKKSFKICRQYGIKTVGYFIIGLPGETVDDINRTIALSVELDCDYASFNVAIPIIGTSLWEDAVKNKWIGSDREKIYDGSLEPIIEYGSVSIKEVSELRKTAYKKFYLRPSYIIKKLTGLRNFYQMKMLFFEFLNLLKKQLQIK